MNHLTFIEPLEDRIAPALILSPTTVTFQGPAGQIAKVVLSKGLFTSPAAAQKILQFSIGGLGYTDPFTGNDLAESLSNINFEGIKGAQDVSVSVTVIGTNQGANTIDVGSISAANFSVPDQVTQNIDLGKVFIQGDLGQITAGDNYSTPAIASLDVMSMNESLQSQILGPVTSLHVHGGMNAFLNLIGYQYGTIDSLKIDGALTGNIQFTGHIGSATIGSIVGGSTADTGELAGTTTNPSFITSLHVLGSITGGAGADSGRVFAESSFSKIQVDGSVSGGGGADSGEIAGQRISSVLVKGSLTGGAGIQSGIILGEAYNGASFVPVPIGKITINGDVIGGTAGVASQPMAATPVAYAPGYSGAIVASGVSTIDILGSLTGGTPGTTSSTMGMTTTTVPDPNHTGDSGGAIFASAKSITIGNGIHGGAADHSGYISGESFGSIVVKGSLSGGAGASSGDIIGAGAGSTVHITGDLAGGSGASSGLLQLGSLGTLNVDGNLTGGTANNAGQISIASFLNTGVIGGNFTGGSNSSATAALVGAGYIQVGQASIFGSQGHLGSLTIGGAVTSGSTAGGPVANDGAIRSLGNISDLHFLSTVSGSAADPFVISAVTGAVGKNPRTDVAIAQLSFDQNVTHAEVLAGYGANVSTGSGSNAKPAGAPLGDPVNGSAQIGSVHVGIPAAKGVAGTMATLTASDLIAGVIAGKTGFGDAGDTVITTKDAAGVEASIAQVIVTGAAAGDGQSATAKTYGIAAAALPQISIDGSPFIAPGAPGIKQINANLFAVAV